LRQQRVGWRGLMGDYANKLIKSTETLGTKVPKTSVELPDGKYRVLYAGWHCWRGRTGGVVRRVITPISVCAFVFYEQMTKRGKSDISGTFDRASVVQFHRRTAKDQCQAATNSA